MYIARLCLKGDDLTRRQDQWPWCNLEVWRDAVAECWLALACTALQWHQCDSECIFVTLEIHLTTLFSEIFYLVTFFCHWTGRDKRTDGQTDIGTDRLFSENIILDCFFLSSLGWRRFKFGNQWMWLNYFEMRSRIRAL